MRRVRRSVLQSAYRLAVLAIGVGSLAGASSAVAAPGDVCPNGAIREAQGPAVLDLPDCMALEQVSPPKKFNQYARNPVIARDGGRVLFGAIAGIGDADYLYSAFSDLFVAGRSSDGWATTSTYPAPPYVGKSTTVAAFSADFSSWFGLLATVDQSADAEPAIIQTYRAGMSGELSLLSPLLVPRIGRAGLGPAFRGASSDGRRVYVETDSPLVDGSAQRDEAYLPGDPGPTPAAVADNNTYVAGLDEDGNPTFELLTRDLDGKAWGGNCGARLGGFKPINGVDLFLPNGERTQGAISSDGGRVLFMTRPGQPSVGECDTVNKMRIMERVETPDGPVISELSESECDRVAPACGTDDGDDVFQGASVDQTKVYFTTNRQLADSDLDGDSTSCARSPVAGCDLYVYDSTKPAGQRLTQVSAGDETAATPGSGANIRNGIAAISADGSHAYFSASSVLTTDPNPEGAIAQDGQNNFYAYSHADGDLAFIGTLAAADTGNLGLFAAGGTWQNAAYPVPVAGTDGEGNEVGGDGHILLFRSRAALAPGDGDNSSDIYRYDADADALTHVSAAAPGGSDDGPFEALRSVTANIRSFTGWASDDGQTVVFLSNEALVPDDDNGVNDGFMWRDGELFRLPGSNQKPGSPQSNPTVSADGMTVSYASNEQLVASDGDSVQDIYALRVAGGFAASIAAPAPCDPLADACQGTGRSPGSSQSETGGGGSGNESPGARAVVSVKALDRAQRAALAKGRKVSLKVTVNQAGRVVVRGSAKVAGRKRRVLGASKATSRAQSVVVSLRLSKAAREQLASKGRLRVQLTVAFPGARKSTSTLSLAKRTASSRKGGRS